MNAAYKVVQECERCGALTHGGCLRHPLARQWNVRVVR